MDPDLQTLVDNYLRWDRNEATNASVKALVDAKDYGALTKLMSPPLEFGTAGLRAAMAGGFARMNDVTVIQAAQGLAAHILATFSKEECASRGVIIGFDARHNSSRFARLSANVFLSQGIRTRLFRQICPTPFVPFGVLHYSALAGVMVTASHNPKQDNGYKVYWSNGAQIIPPTDSDIAAQIAAHQEPADAAWAEQPGAEDPFDEVHERFFATLSEGWAHKATTAASPIAFTYTAMHGVGTAFTLKSLETAGVPAERVVLVKEQVEPDPEFPTVAFPNPEEGKSALNLSFAAAEAAGSSIILANDPDADRLAVAERLPSGAWKVFTGNELGALLGWWALELFKQKNAKESLADCAMVSSAVSSKILSSYAKAEGFYFEETLTGFKWMGSRARSLVEDAAAPKKVLFAFEEAIGFMFGTRVYDKDGVTAAAAFAEMSCWLHANGGLSPNAKLQQLWAQYGFHCSYNSYVTSSDPAQNKAMFDNMRVIEGGQYPTTVAGAKVLSIRDLATGLDTTRADKKAVLPVSAAAPMITFAFDNGVTMTIRGSGTEPKVKWYSEIISQEVEGTEERLKVFIDAAIEYLMNPAKYGFQARKA